MPSSTTDSEPGIVQTKQVRPDAVARLLNALDKHPRIQLGNFPSPVTHGVVYGVKFWIKDDGHCSSTYGGNKIRKLEYLFAKLPPSRSIVVHGDIESHTVQAAGIIGRQLGLTVDAVVFSHRGQSIRAPEIETLRQKRVRIHWRSSMLTAILDAYRIAWQRRAIVVPLGATTPDGTIGYVRAATELMEQIQQHHLPQPGRIFVPFATGGTVAGLLIGLALSESTTRVVAVQTVESFIANRRRLKRLVKKTLNLLGFPSSDSDRCMDRLELIDSSQLGNGYRGITAATVDAMQIARQCHLELEPAFSGKAFAAMLNALRENRDGKLLFWNTHHQPGADR